MKSNKKIGDVFKDNLYDYSDVPSNHVWENIQKNPDLIKYNNKASYTYSKLLTSIAAIVVIGVVSFLIYDNYVNNQNTDVVENRNLIPNIKENSNTAFVSEKETNNHTENIEKKSIVEKNHTNSINSNVPLEVIESKDPKNHSPIIENFESTPAIKKLLSEPIVSEAAEVVKVPIKTKDAEKNTEIIRTVLSVNPIHSSNDTIICRWTGALLRIHGAESVVWFDGSTDTQKFVEPTESAVFVVRAIRNDATDTLIRIFVQVVDCHQIYVPTAFTPDGDGHNDEFKPVYNGSINDYEMLIFTRSSGRVFETKNINIGWDGKISGSQAEEGAYFYVIRYRDSNDKTREQTGQVVLYRSR